MPSEPTSSPASGRQTDLTVHVALLAVQMSFGGFHVIGKLVLEEIGALPLAGLRVGLATPILLLLAWHRDRCLPRPRDLAILAGLGMLGVFLNQFLFIVGLQYTTATNASILMASIPVFAVAAAAALGIERIGRRRLAGIALAVVGALVVLGPGQLAMGQGPAAQLGAGPLEAARPVFLGNLLILVNCLSYSVFLVLQRPILERLPWRTTIAWSFLFGGLAILAVSGPQLAALEPAALSTRAWLGLTYIVALPTLFSYAVNTWAVKRSSASLTAAYTTVQPLFATLLAHWMLGERLGWRAACGFALIAAGLYWVSRRPARPVLPDHE
jgi:drug/metabolite transporter (DMT)-like permease